MRSRSTNDEPPRIYLAHVLLSAKGLHRLYQQTKLPAGRDAMSLRGPQAKQLEKAMQSAYDYAELKRFAAWTLEKKLEKISLGGSLEEVLFELIERALREGWEDELVTKVCEDKPNSPEVASFCQSYKSSPANHQSPASADKEPVSRPPAIHNLPLSPLGSLFRGRDTLLEQLARDLEADPTALTQHQALYGLGGIGKTRLAVEYAWRSGDRYDAVFFVGAESPEDLRRNLAELGARDLLNLELGAVAEEEAVRAVLANLRERSRWLMILDNVDSEKAAKATVELLPRLSGGHVLVTSRLSSWPTEIWRRALDKLELPDATWYLLDRTADARHHCADDTHVAESLARLLDGLPLVLEQAAAYIAAHGLSFGAYLVSWEQERSRVLGWYDETAMRYPKSVAVTWQQSFERLASSSRAVLRLLSHLAPAPIPVAMLTEGEVILAEAPALLGADPVEEATTSLALAELVKYSLITRRKDVLEVHRMVQEVVRSRIPEEQRSEWIEQAMRLVNDFAPPSPDDVRTWLVQVTGSSATHATRSIRVARASP